MNQVPLKIFREKSGLPNEAIYWLIEEGLLPLALSSQTELMVDLSVLDLKSLFEKLSGSYEFRKETQEGLNSSTKNLELQSIIEKIVDTEFRSILEDAKEIWNQNRLKPKG